MRNGQCGLGCDIPFGRASAAGGQDQRATSCHQIDQCSADGGLFVGDQARLKINRVAQGATQPVLQGRQALVNIDAAGSPVTNRHNTNANAIDGDLSGLGGVHGVHAGWVDAVLCATSSLGASCSRSI